MRERKRCITSETEGEKGDGRGHDGKETGRAEEHKNRKACSCISPVNLPVTMKDRFQHSLATLTLFTQN